MTRALAPFVLSLATLLSTPPANAEGGAAARPCVPVLHPGAPSTTELVRAALGEAEMNERPLDTLGAKARWAALMPRVRASFRKSDGLIDLFYGSTDAEALGFRQGLSDTRAWTVSAEWDLARLLDGHDRLRVARIAAAVGQRRVDLAGRLAQSVAEHRRLRQEAARIDEGEAGCPALRGRLLQLATALDVATAQRWKWLELEGDFLTTGGRAASSCPVSPPPQDRDRPRLAAPAPSRGPAAPRSPRPAPPR